MSSEPRRARVLEVPERGAGMRLDRFLAARFRDRSRSALVRGIKAGLVTDATDRPLRASATLRAGDVLHLYLPGIAPDSAPPPLPTVLYEDDRVIALDKPPGLLAHPAGTAFAWSVVGLAKERWPRDRVDLVHRLDRETSGVILLTRDVDANRFLKQVFKEGGANKEYEALARGRVPWDSRALTGPIGSADGPIRIQMAVRPDGLPAHTDVTVLGRTDHLTRVRCLLHTGRTHQIRVHLAHAGHPLLGDPLYAVPVPLALGRLEDEIDDEVVREAAGAPRLALHARRIRFPHPDGHTVHVEAPVPADLAAWWGQTTAPTP